LESDGEFIMAIKYLSGNRLWGTNAERLAMSSGVSKANIKVYYQFDNTTGGLVNQAIPSAGFPQGTDTTNAGTNAGGVSLDESGKISRAYGYDGSTTGYTSIGSDIFTGTGDFSFNAWVYHTAESGGETWLNGGTNQDLAGWGSNDKLFGGNTQNVDATTDSTINTWEMITYTRSSGTQNIYFNGTWEADSANTTNIISGTWWIGGSGTSWNDENWEGRIDEFFVASGRVLTAAEVTKLYNGGSGATLQNLPLVIPDLPNGTIFITSDTNVHYMWDGTDTWNEVA